MMHRLRSVGLLWLMAIPVFQTSAQQSSEVVNGNFTNLTFQRLVRELESTTVYQFYYSPASVDSLRINAESRGKSISAFLGEILQGTALHFIIKGRSVYITRGQPIREILPDDFFDRSVKQETTPSHQVFLDYPDVEKIERLGISEEDRVYDIGKKTAVIGPGNA